MLTLWLPCDRFDVLVSSQSITTVVSKCGPLMWATLAATTNFTTTMTGGEIPLAMTWRWQVISQFSHVNISEFHHVTWPGKPWKTYLGPPNRPKTPCRADETQKSCALMDSAAGQKLKPQTDVLASAG